MAQRLVLPVLATVALTALFGCLTLPAAGDVAKPGTTVTVAGTGSPGYSGDNGPATQAQMNYPQGLAFDGAGNLYIADTANYRLRKVTPDGIITTVAGTGKPGFSGDGGKATDAQLFAAVALAVDGAGNLFIADLANHRVRKVTPDGLISTYAGSGPVEDPTNPPPSPRHGGFSGDNGPSTDARLNGPGSLAVDAQGNLFIADYYNYRVRKVDAATGIITTVAGNGKPGYSGDNGPATAAGMSPLDVAADAAGDLFIVDNPFAASLNTFRVRKVDAVTGIITTVAGAGTAGFSGDGGPAMSARLDHPTVAAVDSAGNLFIADWNNYRVRKVDAASGFITTVAGNGKNQPYAGDGGLATETGLRGPNGGLAIDAGGNLFIADTGYFHGGTPYDERVLKVFGVAARGLLAGMAFPR